MELILTEKKDAAKMIALALGIKTEDKGGYFQSKVLTIIWAQGHLIETCPPEYYDASYKKWRFEHLPVIPDELATRPIKAHVAKVSKIKKLILKADVVINACDCGQEGELIARLIFKHAGFKKKHKRLWFSSLLKDEVKRAYRNLKNSSEYDDLFHCASLRSFVDWIFGYNLTRAFTLKLSGDHVVNTGRVTTPTLTEIVERQLSIDSFIPEKYNVFSFIHNDFKYTSKRLDPSVSSSDGFNRLTVTKSEKKAVTTKPPKLFSLNSLQKEANRIFSFKADKTLSIAEKLYLSGLITYPRTDSEYLPDNFDGSEIRIIFADHNQDLIVDSSNKSIFNSKKVTDHHALIPTKNSKVIEIEDDKQIYDLILKRFFAAFAPCCKSTSITIKGHSNNVFFKATRSIIDEPGFKSIYDFKSSDEKTGASDESVLDSSAIQIPKQGDQFLIDPKIEQRTTKSPPFYTDATLIAFMENAGKVIDEKLTSGIGTVATRAQIIKKLETGKFIKYVGKKIKATEKSVTLIQEIPFDVIKKPYLTLELEKLFDQIKNKTASIDQCKQRSISMLKALFVEINKLKPTVNSSYNKVSSLLCPICKKNLHMTQSGYRCPDSSHLFALPYQICGRKLSETDLQALVTMKKTRVFKNMISKKKKLFSASLSLNADTFKIEFIFSS